MPKSSLLPIPEHNNFFTIQDNELNGYRILDYKKQQLYDIVAKTATTRSHFRVRRKDGVAIASVIQEMDTKYEILGVNDEKLSVVKIDQERIQIKIGKEPFTAKAIARAKEFVFEDDQGRMVMTVDKKLVSKHDNYHIVFVEKFPSLVAAVIGVIIDDVYHKGLLK